MSLQPDLEGHVRKGKLTALAVSAAALAVGAVAAVAPAGSAATQPAVPALATNPLATNPVATNPVAINPGVIHPMGVGRAPQRLDLLRGVLHRLRAGHRGRGTPGRAPGDMDDRTGAAQLDRDRLRRSTGAACHQRHLAF